MKNTLYILLSFLIGCSKNNSNETLFLDFNSGISKEEFIAIANKDPKLKIQDEHFPEYTYEISLKSSTVKAGLKPFFQLQNGKLYQIYIHGEAKSNSDLIEIENMFMEKYKTPKTSKENTFIKFEPITCSTWTTKNKEVRFCRDSFPNFKIKILSSLEDKIAGKPVILDTIQSNLLYFFEIYYTDKIVENENLNAQTKKEL
jgi:hypothetical protein